MPSKPFHGDEAYKQGYDTAEKFYKKKAREREKALLQIIKRLDAKLRKIDRIINPQII